MTTQRSQNNSEREQREHLARLCALSQELASAISAIERNDLARLQSSVANQEAICAQLTAAKWRPATAPALAPRERESGLLDDIRNAQVALAQTNRVYAALLRRSRFSAGLMAALYRSYRSGYAKEAPPAAEQHTLSCEV